MFIYSVGTLQLFSLSQTIRIECGNAEVMLVFRHYSLPATAYVPLFFFLMNIFDWTRGLGFDLRLQD